MVKQIWKLSHYYTIDEHNTTSNSFSHLSLYLGYLKLKLALDEFVKVPKSSVRGQLDKAVKLTFRPWKIFAHSESKDHRFQLLFHSSI
jgi:hypothetical protein